MGESPLPASGDEIKETSAASNLSKKKPKWRLPVVLCVVAAIAAGVCLWLRNAGESKADISEIADSVLYLEVFDEDDELIASASGFLVGDQNILVTNYHVVQDAYHIVAWTADGTQSTDVSSILVYDEVADLAVLNCDSKAAAEPLTLGNSERVRQGDKVYAVGYPLGLANTLSDGIVSSRYFDEYDIDIIQVTAAISHGNSGGPLLDTNGRVIGIMCASYIYGQNLNVAIASDTLAKLLASGFHEVSLTDWDDRPEMSGYELDEEEQEPDAGDPSTGNHDNLSVPDLDNPETNNHSSEAPAFQPMNPDWTDTMKLNVDPRFHGTWNYYMVDNFVEQNEIELAGNSSCSIDLNHGVMAFIFDGSLNNRQYFSITDQKNTICQYYENEYCTAVTTYVLVSDNTIQSTYVLTHKDDESQTIQYTIYEKTSDLAYDSGAYM